MPDNNKLDWEQYEAITQYIYGALGEQYNINVKGYGRNCKVTGRSKVEHQIDVLTEQFEGDRQLLTAIECKCWNKKVDKEVVMKLSEIMLDADVASGIIVCKSGFTKDTLTFAQHKGIKLVELSEAGENDADFQKIVEIGLIDFNFKVIRSHGKVTSINLGSRTIAGEDELMGMWYVKLHDVDGRTIAFSEFMKAFSEEVQRRGDLLKTITIAYPLTHTLFWKLHNDEIAIENITITGFFEKKDLSSTKSFRLTDQVWMIINELFDKRKLTLSKSGLIWHLPSDS